jgi:hypothetical protein
MAGINMNDAEIYRDAQDHARRWVAANPEQARKLVAFCGQFGWDVNFWDDPAFTPGQHLAYAVTGEGAPVLAQKFWHDLAGDRGDELSNNPMWVRSFIDAALKTAKGE